MLSSVVSSCDLISIASCIPVVVKGGPAGAQRLFGGTERERSVVGDALGKLQRGGPKRLMIPIHLIDKARSRRLGAYRWR